MATPADPPAPLRSLWDAGELRMLLADMMKYGVLAVSVAMLLLALSAAAWQVVRGCRQTHAAHTQQDAVDGDRISSKGKLTASGNCSGDSSMKVMAANTEACGLSLASFLSSGSSQSDGDTGETQVDGSIRFSVSFDELRSLLVVTVLQVEGLLEAEPARSLRPFVRLLLMCAESEGDQTEGFQRGDAEAASPVLWTVLHEWRTRVVKGSRSPFFGEQFSCFLREERDKLRHINLRMEVRGFDKFSRHAVFGEVRVPLGRILSCCPAQLHEALQAPHKDVVGALLLSLKFLPMSQRLEVGLLKIRTFRTRSDAAIFARISVQCNRSKLRHQKTAAAASSPDAVFNEVLIFPLPESPVERCRVTLHVYETRAPKRSAKRLIGQLSVGKERRSEDEHWTLMMRSLRQPVAAWHRLLL